MTVPSRALESERTAGRPSLLPFHPADLTAMRVLPVDFARMCGVSKQAVSQWIKQGKVTIGPDGRLDPAIASRQVIERTDPARLRAQVFKHATAGVQELRARVFALESELGAARAELSGVARAVGFRHDDQVAERLGDLVKALVEGFAGLAGAATAGDLDAAIWAAVDPIFYPGCTPEADEDYEAEAEDGDDAADLWPPLGVLADLPACPDALFDKNEGDEIAPALWSPKEEQ